MTINRRNFIKGALATSITAALPINWVFAQQRPKELAPLNISALNWTNVDNLPKYFHVLNSNPLNAFPPEHLLDPANTPADVAFIRWNGKMPDFKSIDPDKWTFTLDGESITTPKTFTIAELKKKFKHHTQQLTIECGGNSRKEFYPNAKGNQWSNSAVFCSQWTGVLVKDVLAYCGVEDDAVYTAHYGLDKHLSGKGMAISRGVPIQAAMTENALIAWSMNGEDIPYMHGYPLRIVYGGRPGSVSQKCATGMGIRDRVHDGKKMEAPAYQVPKYPVAPGEKVDNKDFKIIEEMIVKSMITSPQTASEITLGNKLEVRGHAWAGVRNVAKVDISFDYGTTWQQASLTKAVNPSAWQQWALELTLPQKGYYEIWAKATDNHGDSQPMVQPQWNPKGYLFNGCHRIAVRVV